MIRPGYSEFDLKEAIKLTDGGDKALSDVKNVLFTCDAVVGILMADHCENGCVESQQTEEDDYCKANPG